MDATEDDWTASSWVVSHTRSPTDRELRGHMKIDGSRGQTTGFGVRLGIW